MDGADCYDGYCMDEQVTELASRKYGQETINDKFSQRY